MTSFAGRWLWRGGTGESPGWKLAPKPHMREMLVPSPTPRIARRGTGVREGQVARATGPSPRIGCLAGTIYCRRPASTDARASIGAIRPVRAICSSGEAGKNERIPGRTRHMRPLLVDRSLD